MLHTEYGIYLAEDTENILTDIVTDDHFYILMTVNSSYTKEKMRALLNELKEELIHTKPQRLKEFEAVLVRADEEVGREYRMSLVGTLRIGSIIYVITRGEGKTYIKRDNHLSEIIQGDMSASGKVVHGDHILMTVSRLSTLIPLEELVMRIGANKPSHIIEDITPHLKKQRDEGIVLFLLHMWENQERSSNEEYAKTTVTEVDSKKISTDMIKEHIKPYLLILNSILSGRKKLSLVAGIGILVVLLNSVVGGIERRDRSQIISQTIEIENEVSTLLSHADEIAPLDLGEALEKVLKAKEITTLIRAQAGKKNIKNIDVLDKLERRIADKEYAIRKKEEGTLTEYYDLALIDKSARGSKLAIFEKTIGILDTENGQLYTLDSDSKSVETYTDPVIKEATDIALYKDKAFFLTRGEVYVMNSNNKKAIRAIEKDEWGRVTDIEVFNGNVYLLDSEKDEVYKYLVTEGGYSNKTSYFKGGQAIELKKNAQMAIDGAIYILSDNSIFKYLSGKRENFSVNSPDKLSGTHIFTIDNLDVLYIWDKDTSRLSLYSKEGEYRKQLTAKLLNKAQDVIVLPDGSVLVLAETNIYTLK